MQGKLNVFQRTVLLWNEMHAYNAVHVVRVPKELDMTRLTETVDTVLTWSGLVELAVDGRQKGYHYGNSPSRAEIKLLKESSPRDALIREIRKQINLPFSGRGNINPFRFFVIRDEAAFSLGLVYFHLVADADSIIRLLKSIVERYRAEKTVPLPRLSLYPGAYRKLLPFRLRYLKAWITTLPDRIADVRRSIRPRYADIYNSVNGFHLFTIESPHYHSLIAAAHRWDVTLNDIFLALLMKSLAPLAVKRKTNKKLNLSVSCIATIRKDLAGDSSNVFGLFLSSFNVSHEVPDQTGLLPLVKDIHQQTEEIKSQRIYLRTLLEMWAALALIPCFFSRRKEKFYVKYNPVWGGITNIQVNRFWGQSNEKIPLDYLRAVSTGQGTPLVFSFTTVNDWINVGVSYRETVFSEEDITTVLTGFTHSMSQLNGVDE